MRRSVVLPFHQEGWWLGVILVHTLPMEEFLIVQLELGNFFVHVLLLKHVHYLHITHSSTLHVRNALPCGQAPRKDEWVCSTLTLP